MYHCSNVFYLLNLKQLDAISVKWPCAIMMMPTVQHRNNGACNMIL